MTCQSKFQCCHKSPESDVKNLFAGREVRPTQHVISTSHTLYSQKKGKSRGARNMYESFHVMYVVRVFFFSFENSVQPHTHGHFAANGGRRGSLVIETMLVSASVV